MATISPVVLADLTTGTVDGTGVFDKLMIAAKAHLDAEQRKGTIRGPEYSQVYLGQVQTILGTAVQFLMNKDKVALEAEVLQNQVLLTQAQVDLVRAQIEAAEVEKSLTIAQAAKVNAETLNVPKQGAMIEAQTTVQAQQKLNLEAEVTNLTKQGLKIDADIILSTQQKANLAAEGLNIPKQGLQMDAQTLQTKQQTLNLVADNLGIVARTDLTTQQKANAVIEGTVLVAQECKLRAEYDLTMANVLKSNGEIALVAQKTSTEKAQTQEMGVDDNSVIGKQKKLYQAQTDGFARDAEQKAAKIVIDTWNARRMTDDATVADGVNKLNDSTIGAFVDKMRTGVGA